VQDLEQEVAAKTRWALDSSAELAAKVTELATAVDALHETEKQVEERTAWALGLEKEGQQLKEQLDLLRASRWMKLGRKIGFGPVLPPA
jgi:hypothetical protein